MEDTHAREHTERATQRPDPALICYRPPQRQSLAGGCPADVPDSPALLPCATCPPKRPSIKRQTAPRLGARPLRASAPRASMASSPPPSPRRSDSPPSSPRRPSSPPSSPRRSDSTRHPQMWAHTSAGSALQAVRDQGLRSPEGVMGGCLARRRWVSSWSSDKGVALGGGVRVPGESQHPPTPICQAPPAPASVRRFAC